MSSYMLKYGITIAAVAMGIAHIAWPQLKIDAITVTLVFIAIAPWAAPLLKSLELPGGWKFQFQDLLRVEEKANRAGLLTESNGTQEMEYSFQYITEKDPKLALAGLRIEIEKRLVEIAESNSIPVRDAGIRNLLRILSERGVLSQQQRIVLNDITSHLNAAVHGGEIDNRAAEWVLDVGTRLLKTLDALIHR
jgi:hypothetical protein